MFLLLLLVVMHWENISSQSIVEEQFDDHEIICYIFGNKSPSFVPITDVHQSVKVDFNHSLSDSRNWPFKCDGYVIDIDENNIIFNQIFSVDSINLYLCPHRKALIIVKEVPENLENLKKSVLIHNMNITIARTVEEEITTKVKTTKFRTLLVEEFIQNKWVPKEILQKVGHKVCVGVFDCKPYFTRFEDNSFGGIDNSIIMQVLRNWPLEIYYLEGDNAYDEVSVKVKSNECDVAMCAQWAFTDPNEKIRQNELTSTYWYICEAFLVPRPELLPNATFIFQPFQFSLWILYILITVLVALVLKMVSSASINDSFIGGDLGLAVLYSFQVFSLGSLKRTPGSSENVSRILIAVWLIVSMLMATYYAAGLTISLRFPRFSRKIDTLDDMVSENVKWIETESFHHVWMEKTNHSALKQLSKQYIIKTNPTEINQLIREQNCARLVQVTYRKEETYVSYAETLDEFSRNNMKLLLDPIRCFYTVFKLKYNSPYQRIFDRSLLLFNEFGFINRWYTEFIRRSENRYMLKFLKMYSQEIRQTIDLVKLQGIFLFWAIGMGVSLLVFFVELYFRRNY